MSSRISGLGLKGIAGRVIDMHEKAYASDNLHYQLAVSSVIENQANVMRLWAVNSRYAACMRYWLI